MGMKGCDKTQVSIKGRKPKRESLFGIRLCLKFEIKFSSEEPERVKNSFGYAILDREEPTLERKFNQLIFDN